MEDFKLQIILVVLVVIAFVAGFALYQKVSQREVQPKNEIAVSAPTPVRNQATTSGTNLPRTAAPVVLIGIFAASALISGFFLRKFPE